MSLIPALGLSLRTNQPVRGQMDGWRIAGIGGGGAIPVYGFEIRTHVREALTCVPWGSDPAFRDMPDESRALQIADHGPATLDLALYPSDHASRWLLAVEHRFEPNRRSLSGTIPPDGVETHDAALTELATLCEVHGRIWMAHQYEEPHCGCWRERAGFGFILWSRYVSTRAGVLAQIKVGGDSPHSPGVYDSGHRPGEWALVSLAGASDGGCEACHVALNAWAEAAQLNPTQLAALRRFVCALRSTWSHDPIQYSERCVTVQRALGALEETGALDRLTGSTLTGHIAYS